MRQDCKLARAHGSGGPNSHRGVVRRVCANFGSSFQPSLLTQTLLSEHQALLECFGVTHCQQPDSQPQPWASREEQQGIPGLIPRPGGWCSPSPAHYAQINFLLNCLFRTIGNLGHKPGWPDRFQISVCSASHSKTLLMPVILF